MQGSIKSAMEFKDLTIIVLVIWAAINFFNPAINQAIADRVRGKQEERGEHRQRLNRLRAQVDRFAYSSAGSVLMAPLVSTTEQTMQPLMLNHLNDCRNKIEEYRKFVIENRSYLSDEITKLLDQMYQAHREQRVGVILSTAEQLNTRIDEEIKQN